MGWDRIGREGYGRWAEWLAERVYYRCFLGEGLDWVWVGRGCGVAVRAGWRRVGLVGVGAGATVVSGASRTGGLSDCVDERGGVEWCSGHIGSLSSAPYV